MTHVVNKINNIKSISSIVAVLRNDFFNCLQNVLNINNSVQYGCCNVGITIFINPRSQACHLIEMRLSLDDCVQTKVSSLWRSSVLFLRLLICFLLSLISQAFICMLCRRETELRVPGVITFPSATW